MPPPPSSHPNKSASFTIIFPQHHFLYHHHLCLTAPYLLMAATLTNRPGMEITLALHPMRVQDVEKHLWMIFLEECNVIGHGLGQITGFDGLAEHILHRVGDESLQLADRNLMGAGDVAQTFAGLQLDAELINAQVQSCGNLALEIHPILLHSRV